MGLIKSRPKVQILTPRVVHPGQSFVARVELDARRPVPLDWLDVWLIGKVLVIGAAGGSTTRSEHSLVDQVARVCKDTELPQGRTRYECRFSLPDGLPPSYSGHSAFVSYTLSVHGNIPWWPDLRQSFSLAVQRPDSTAASQEPTPGLYSSDPSGPRAGVPHAELSVSDTVLPAGGVVSGAVALSNVATSGYTSVSVALVGHEVARVGGSLVETECARYELHIPVERLTEGESSPIRMRVPDVSPTLETPLFRLTWGLEIRAKRRLASDLTLRVPLRLTPSSGATAVAGERRAPPAVGSERLARIWDAAAAQVGLERQGEQLRGRVGDVSIRLFREQRGRRGYWLVAELSFESLHLGLDGGLKTGFRRVFLGDDHALGDARWDRLHYLTGTDEGQVRAFAEALKPALVQARVADISDERIVFEIRSAGLGGEPLGSLARNALDAAGRVGVARAAIPPPAGFELEPWQALARFVSGTLETARMIARGELEGHAVRVATEWSRTAPLDTVVELSPRAPLDARYHGEIRLEAGGAPALLDEDGEPRLAELNSELERCLRVTLKDAAHLSVSATELTLALPGPRYDAASITPLLVELCRLAELMSVRRGAYR